MFKEKLVPAIITYHGTQKNGFRSVFYFSPLAIREAKTILQSMISRGLKAELVKVPENSDHWSNTPRPKYGED